MQWFALASLTPAGLLILACLFGGDWSYLALGGITVFVYVVDRMTRTPSDPRPGIHLKRSALNLSVFLTALHFVLLPLGIYALVRHPDLTGLQSFALGVGLGLFFGQISNSTAHELIHRSGRRSRFLGKAIYTSLLFGHHASAHPRVHHVWVASDTDPNSARLGQSFYQFWPRAWIGSFRAGLQAENRLRQGQTPAAATLNHPYVTYCAGALATVLLAFLLAGPQGVFTFLILAIYAQMQLMLSDYVQHYGLRRAVLENGSLEPVGMRHAWNAAPWYSAAMMLNAPRHSDHHVNPARAFPELALNKADMPMLPSSFPVMCAIALIPSLWRRIMDHRARRWSPSSGRSEPNLAQSEHV